jgi:uncharacterized damage-inducible protein DinB
MKDHFREFAAYNAWANRRLFMALCALDDERRKRSIGLFFASLHGTLNHLLVTDRMWLGLLTGRDPETGPIDKILYPGFEDLTRSRLAEDARLSETIERYEDDDFKREISYPIASGVTCSQPLAAILAHLFNHQTHHRAQAHTGLSIITGREPDDLGLLPYQRGVAAPTIAEVLEASRG